MQADRKRKRALERAARAAIRKENNPEFQVTGPSPVSSDSEELPVVT